MGSKKCSRRVAGGNSKPARASICYLGGTRRLHGQQVSASRDFLHTRPPAVRVVVEAGD